MRWGDVERKETADGTAFLEYNERQTKTPTGADPKDSRTVAVGDSQEFQEVSRPVSWNKYYLTGS